MKLTNRLQRQNCSYEKASCLSRITFSWVTPVINTVRKRTFTMQDHDDLPEQFDVSKSIAKFEKEFEQHKSLWRLFFSNIDKKCQLIFMNLVFTISEIANVWLLYLLTEYLKEIKEGRAEFERQKLALFFGLMILCNLSLNYLETIYDFLLLREFMKIKNNLTLLVIKYVLKIHIHGNSETSKGNLVNLIQMDCAAVEEVGFELVLSTYLLFLFLICFVIGFALFGSVFSFYILSCVVFMLVAVFFLNICIKINKRFMDIRDDRVSFISSMLTNLRFVKFNVLENYFAKIVDQYRQKEIRLLWAYNFVYALVVFFDWVASSMGRIAFIIMYFYFNSRMALQSYVAFINLDFMLANNFSMLPWVFSAIFRIRLAFYRINKFFKIQPFSSNIITTARISFGQEENCNEEMLEQKLEVIKNEEGQFQSGINELILENLENVAQNKEYSIKMRNVNFSYLNPEIEEFEEIMEEDEESSSSDEPDFEEEAENEDNNFIADSPFKFQNSPVNPEKNEPGYKLHKHNLALHKINLNIKKSELVFVIGSIGSGKSSLLYSLLGELNQIYSDNIANESQKGEEFIKIAGTLSFCPHKPFILTKSIKDNILFYEEEDKEKLARAINMACLGEDLANSDEGIDKLLIENGMNISGGQRSRVNLARCFYKESDIYLLDSPFSALDFDTSKKIMEETIVKALGSKTRIVVTHNIQFLKYGDRIVVMKRGKVAFSGNFQEFVDSRFYGNYQFSEKFAQPENIVTKAEISLRKRSKSKCFVEIGDPKFNTSKLSNQIIPFTNEQKEYFKGFLNEDRVEGRQLKKMFGLIFRYYGGVILLFILFCACLALNYMYYISSIYLYDMIEHNQTSGKKFWKNMRVYILLNLMPAIIDFLKVIILGVFSVRTSKKLHRRMIFEVLHADLCLFHDKIEPGRIINRFSGDFDSVDFYIVSYIDQSILLFSFLCFEIFVTKEATSVYLIATFIFYYIAIFYYQDLYIKARKDLYRLERIGNSPIVNLTSQIVEGSAVIKVFKKQEQIISELAQKINENSKNTVTIASLNGWFNTRLAIINIFFIQLFSFLYIIIFTDKNNMNAKQVEIFISLLFVMIFDSKEFMQNFSMLETETINLERCDALLFLPSEKQYLNLSKNRKMMSKISKLKLSALLPVKEYGTNNLAKYSYKEINEFNFNKAFFLKGRITFDSIFAKYPLMPDYVLKNVSFDLLPGEKLGIIGKTGSGKSTILKLLLQYFSPEKGKIFVDDYDICKIDAKKSRSEFLVISQEITLFQGTLRDNLIFETEIHKNLQNLKINSQENSVEVNQQRQNLQEPLLSPEQTLKDESQNLLNNEKEIVEKLIEFGFSKSKLSKYGLDLKIANNGDNLSTGEQQLISFFKAFFTKKQIIFLDEATAPFDFITQQKLIDYFNLKIKGKTVISVAHKILAIADFDKILVLENGFVIEYGQIKELLQRESSHFRDLINQYFKI